MKRLLTFLTVLFATLTAFAQGDSPYARFGYEGKVLRTPQERQQRMMLIVPNPDTTATVAKVGLDPAKQRYYLFDKQNQVLVTDTITATIVSKFLSVDPLTGIYSELTPYQFASNRPIDGIDRDGLEFEPYWASTLPSKIRQYEAELRRKDPVHAEQTIQNNNLQAFAFVGGPLFGSALGAGILRFGPSALSYAMTSPTLVPGLAGTIASVFDPNPASDYPGLGDDLKRLFKLSKGARYVFGYRWNRAAVEFSSEVGATFAKVCGQQRR